MATIQETVYVRAYPAHATIQDFNEMFRHCGTIRGITMFDEDEDEERYATVTFTSKGAKQEALKLHGSFMLGQSIDVALHYIDLLGL